MKMAAPEDLEALYDAHAQALFGFLLSLTRNESDTRDLLQEILIRFARNPKLLRGIRQPRGFLLRLAHNLAVDLIRRREAGQRAGDRLLEESPRFFADTSRHDEAVLRRATQVALNGLPPEQRATVHLKLWENMTFEQIAETLDIPMNTAASRYRYGIDKLRHALRLIYNEMI